MDIVFAVINNILCKYIIPLNEGSLRRSLLMKKPHDEIREYFKKLFHRYLYITSLHQELKTIYGWSTSARIEALNEIGGGFFSLVIYNFQRTVLLELSMFLSEKEKRSLFNWLKEAKKHAASVKPTSYKATNDKHELIETETYCAIIDDQIAQLQDRENIINRIKAHRDKGIAHLEKKFFDIYSISLDEKYPLNDADIDELMEVVSCILQKQYSCLFKAGTTTKVGTLQGVDKVLRYTYAWAQVRKDFDLIEGNKVFRSAEYE